MNKGLNFITHQMLVTRAQKWLENAHGNEFACGVVLAEYRCYSPEIPDVIGFNNHHSVLIECKVNRADFKADKYKSHRHHIKGLGNYRYYLTLPHVACPEEIPSGWGLLYATEKRIVKVKDAQYFGDDAIKSAEWSILYSIMRRLNLRGLLKDVQKPLGEPSPSPLGEG